MKRLIPVIIILAIAAALSGALYWGLHTLKPGKYKENLEQRLEARLNADVEIGAIAPIIYPGLGVQFKDIRLTLLSGEESEESRDVFSAKSLKVVINNQVLRDERKLLIREIYLYKPRIELRRGPDGKWDLKNLVKEKPSEEPEEAPEKEKARSKLTKRIAERARGYLPETGSLQEFLFHLERIVILNAELTLIDERERKPALLAPVNIAGVDLTIDCLEQEDAAHFVLNTVFPQRGDKKAKIEKLLDISGDLVFDYPDQRVRIENLKGRWGSNFITAADAEISRKNGKLSLNSKAELDVDLHEIRALLLAIPIRRIEGISPMNFAGKARVALSTSWPGPGAEPRLTYDVKSVIFKARFDPGMIISPIKNISGAANIKDRTVTIPRTEVVVSGQPLEADFFYNKKAGASWYVVNARGNGTNLGRLFRPADEPSNAGDISYRPMASQWHGKAVFNDSRYENIQIERLRSEWNFVNRILYFNKFKASICDGRFTDIGTWVAFNRRDSVSYLVEGKIRDMKLARFFEEVFGIKFFIDGTFSVDGYLFGRIKEGTLKTHSINGKFSVKVTDGEFIGYNLSARLLGFLGIPIDQEKYGRYFDKLKADMVIKDGVIYFDDIKVKSWSIEAHAAGSVDLKDEKLNLWVQIYPLEGLSTLTKPLPLIGDIVNLTQEALFGYYTRVEGDWDEPEIRVYNPLTEKIPAAPDAMPKPKPPREIKRKASASQADDDEEDMHE